MGGVRRRPPIVWSRPLTARIGPFHPSPYRLRESALTLGYTTVQLTSQGPWWNRSHVARFCGDTPILALHRIRVAWLLVSAGVPAVPVIGVLWRLHRRVGHSTSIM